MASQLPVQDGPNQQSGQPATDHKAAMHGLSGSQHSDATPTGMTSSQSIAGNVPPKIDEVVEPT